MAIAGEWVATGEELTGEVDVSEELLIGDAWTWTDTLVKRGTGELVLDLDGGFSASSTAALAIVEGRVRLTGTSQTLSLDALTFGELGQLAGNPALAGQYGWYGPVMVPEPEGLILVAIGLVVLGSWRRGTCMHV